MTSTNYLLDYSFDEEYAKASVTSNNNITWVKFTFTDDQPNKNNQRIPQEEFASIIKSGVHMPIKMESENPNGGHELSTPIGTITNLVQQDNKVIGLAALWKQERVDDVSLLEQMYKDGNPLGLSWEVFFSESSTDKESGIETLLGTTVRAITFVGNPAYAGRTNVVAMAEEQSKEKETQTLDELQELKDEVASLTAKLSEKEQEIETLKAETTQSAKDEEEMASVLQELEALRSYKSEREAKDALAELLTSRRGQLSEAGIELSDDDFNARSEKLANMSDEMFEFYVQELAAFSTKNNSTEAETTAETNGTTIPAVTMTEPKDAKEILLSAIREGQLS